MIQSITVAIEMSKILGIHFFGDAIQPLTDLLLSTLLCPSQFAL